MRNKADVIRKFKEFEGKEVTVITQTYIGSFTPYVLNTFFWISAEVKQKRRILSVKTNSVQTEILESEIIGYENNRKAYLDKWFKNNFDRNLYKECLEGANIEALTELVHQDFTESVEEFDLVGEVIHCDFPKVAEMTIRENSVNMYGTEFIFE